jgi:lipopolysaccharide export system protein LptA
MNHIKYLLLSALVILNIGILSAQKREKIKYEADELENIREDGLRYKKLIGNVVFTHRTTIINCDSAYFYSKENKMEAYGNVHIKDGDTVTITSKKLIYEGSAGKAQLRDDVVYSNTKETLYTDFLDYDSKTKISKYFNNGKLVDKDNILTSEICYYHDIQKFAEFYNDVVLYSQEYDLEADTLKYFTSNNTGITYGPTKIITKDGVVVNSEGGKFKTARKLNEFTEGVIESKNYTIIGDELYFDDLSQIYTAIGNVELKSKRDNILIYGDKATYDKNIGVSKVFGKPLMKKLMRIDTFFLTADTLKVIENEDKFKERILAYSDVKLFKSNIQGIADSLSYVQIDSMIYMYKDPVLWNHNSQIEADSIDIRIASNQIDKMFMRKNSFMVSKDSLGQYNQIKGRDMVSHFKNDLLETVDVNGNGQSLYFVLEGDSLLLGVNNIYCSDMLIQLENNELKNITFYQSPEAKFIPPHELQDSDQLLEGFDWRIKERPTRAVVLGKTKKVIQKSIDPKSIITPFKKRLKQPFKE